MKSRFSSPSPGCISETDKDKLSNMDFSCMSDVFSSASFEEFCSLNSVNALRIPVRIT